MKKQKSIVIALLFVMTLFLSACGQVAADKAKDPPETAENAPQVSSENEDYEVQGDAAYQGINADGIVFDSPVQDYLNAFGDADSTLSELEPMLVSVAFAVDATGAEFYVGDEPTDAAFEWNTMLYYINTYEFRNDTVTRSDDNFTVPTATMEDFYYDIFGTANIPEVPDELTSSISYDAPSDSYHVIASSGEGLSYIVSDIVISMSDSSANSAKSAVITFDGLDIDNNVHNTVCVEIEYSADSSYLYTVISAYPTNDSE